MAFIFVNIIPIAVTALFPIVLGYIWYHPKAFGVRWMALSGILKQTYDLNKNKIFKKLIIHYLLSFVTTYMVAVLVMYMIVFGVVPAIFLAFKIWLAFVVAYIVINNIYEPNPKPKELLAISLGYHFISLCGISIILAFWLS